MRNEELIVNVIFDAAKGSVTQESREAIPGMPLGTLPRPVRRGYQFEGWYWNGLPVTEETVLQSDEDIRLVARWSKKAKRDGDRRVSMYRRQRVAALVLAIVTVFLSVALVISNHLAGIYPMQDEYVAEDGTLQTEKYYVKKSNGSYALFDRNGNAMEQNSDGYFIAKSGNQYEIDPESGACERYAVVDYDAASGEVLGVNDRVMMFPQITTKNVYSIEVQNEYGSYRVYRDKDGDMVLEGHEKSPMTLDPTMISSLCVSCGYSLTLKKLDFSADSTAPRLEDGSIDYAAYGLTDRYDDAGNLVSPATYTITKASYLADGTCVADPGTVYTVRVGDKLLSDGGYYVQLEGREAVYLMSTTLSKTVLQPAEVLVTPEVVYSTSMLAYSMSNNFLLGIVDINDFSDSESIGKADIEPIVSFTYEDLALREYTLYSSAPYVGLIDLLKGYEINVDNATAMFNLFSSMEFLSCKRIGWVTTPQVLPEYGFSEKARYLSFDTPVLNDSSYIVGYVSNPMLISDKTENGTYYIASVLYDMIVEVDQYYLSFMEWEQSDWYDEQVFRYNISYIKDLNFKFGDREYSFVLDNSKSNQSQNLNSDKLEIYSPQYKDGGKLDYTLVYELMNDKGKMETHQLAAVRNFRYLYRMLMTLTLEGDVDEDAFMRNMGMSVEDYIAQGDGVCQAIFSFSAEDLAKTLNKCTVKNNLGETVKLYTENNKQDCIIRFYQYSARKSMITIELINEYDENGEPISDPTNVVGRFYVLSSEIENLESAIIRLLTEDLVVPDAT